MSVPAPHFLLYARANRAERSGRWCFALESDDGSHSMRIEDAEPDTTGERLELLALVRGLEALPSPANVTVVASSSYLSRMLSGGLDEWRANGWRWEHHGEMVPVKNADLWRRVDRAMDFHEVRLGTRSIPGDASPDRHNDAASVPSIVPSAAKCGAPRALSGNRSAPSLARRRTGNRKSLARKVLGTATVARHKLKRYCRRLCEVVEALTAEGDECVWAD